MQHRQSNFALSLEIKFFWDGETKTWWIRACPAHPRPGMRPIQASVKWGGAFDEIELHRLVHVLEREVESWLY